MSMRKRPARHGEVAHSQNGKPDRQSSRSGGERQPAASRLRPMREAMERRPCRSRKGESTDHVPGSFRSIHRHCVHSVPGPFGRASCWRFRARLGACPRRVTASS